MALVMELRKCCNHPFLIDGTEDHYIPTQSSLEDVGTLLINTSGKLVLLDKLLIAHKS